LSEPIKQPLISIIILNYNGSKYLSSCLGSVLRSLYSSFEIIFVDNASTDNSVSIASSFKNHAKGHKLEIVNNSANLGFSRGNNIGVKHAGGEYVVFLNNDTIVEPTWLQELVTVIEKDKKIGAAQSKLLVRGQAEMIFDSAGDFIDFYCSVVRRGAGKKDIGQYEDIEEVFSARGACMIVRHSVLKEVGGFDPDFVLGYEDIDLCWRIRLRGYKVVYVPRSVVFHKGYGSSSYLRKVNRDPHPLLMIKNYDAFNLTLYFPPYLLGTLGAFVLDVFLRRNLYLAVSRFDTMRWSIFNFRGILAKRYVVQRLIRRVPDKTVKRMMHQSNFTSYTRLILKTRAAPDSLEKPGKYFMENNPLNEKLN
jgi:GT2 family glycosyltransferase